MRWFLFWIVFAVSASTHGQVIFVDKNAAEGGDGTTWGTAYRYLQDALQVATGTSEIWIAEGTYYPEEGASYVDQDRNARFEMINGLKLYGGFTGTESSLDERGSWQDHPTVLSGKVGIYGLWSNNLIYFPSDATAHLNALTITGATSEAVESANYSYTVHLKNCRFTENSGGIGSYGTWYVRFCVFDRNTATFGPAISRDGNWYVDNSVFFLNQSTVEVAVAYRGNWYVNNSVFVGNAAGSTSLQNETSLSYEGNWFVCNSTFYQNTGTYTGNIAFNSSWTLLNSIIHHPGATSPFSQNSSFKDYTDLLLTNYTTRAENIVVNDSSVQFVNPSDPIGPDGRWFTEDDGLRLLSTSPAIGIGSTELLQYDYQDIDEDGDIIEKLPIDATGMTRLQGGFLDLGAYAFDRSLPYRLIVTSSSGGVSNTDGVTFWADNDLVTLVAAPYPGYVFDSWSGISDSTAPSITLTMDADKEIQANFVPDLADDDGDTLTNYDEEVIHGTDPQKADTSGDGFSDSLLIGVGLDPRSDYSPLLSQIDYAALGYYPDSDGNGLTDAFESSPNPDSLASLGFYSLQAIEDARAGSTILQKSPSGGFTLQLQIERSNDLQTWTRSPSDLVEVEVSAPSDKEFLRFGF